MSIFDFHNKTRTAGAIATCRLAVEALEPRTMLAVGVSACDTGDSYVCGGNGNTASAVAADVALLAWADSAEDEDTDPLAAQAANELALMLME